jgi:hypothetical protein
MKQRPRFWQAKIGGVGMRDDNPTNQGRAVHSNDAKFNS